MLVADNLDSNRCFSCLVEYRFDNKSNAELGQASVIEYV